MNTYTVRTWFARRAGRASPVGFHSARNRLVFSQRALSSAGRAPLRVRCGSVADALSAFRALPVHWVGFYGAVQPYEHCCRPRRQIPSCNGFPCSARLALVLPVVCEVGTVWILAAWPAVAERIPVRPPWAVVSHLALGHCEAVVGCWHPGSMTDEYR